MGIGHQFGQNPVNHQNTDMNNNAELAKKPIEPRENFQAGDLVMWIDNRINEDDKPMYGIILESPSYSLARQASDDRRFAKVYWIRGGSIEKNHVTQLRVVA